MDSCRDGHPAVEFRVENIAFAHGHGGQLLFSGLALDLEAGFFHGILGPNGSGKTTLLDLLTGHHHPREGRVLLRNRDLRDIPRQDLARACALVPQDFRVNFPFTVFQVVMMGRYPHMARFAGPSRQDLHQVEEAMDAAGVTGFTSRCLTDLSGGERQRVVFARALAQTPRILILDEATSNLDIKHTLSLLDLVRNQVRMRGITAIAVMQDINLAARYCDSLVFLKGGAVAAKGAVDEVMTEDIIEEVFEVKGRIYEDEAIGCRQVVFLSA